MPETSALADYEWPTCSCGTLLRVTVSTPGARCRGCNTQYGRSEVLELPLAARAAA